MSRTSRRRKPGIIKAQRKRIDLSKEVSIFAVLWLQQGLQVPSPLWGEGWGGEGIVKSPAPALRARARRLRHDQTESERRLWARLRNRQMIGAKFRRQHPIGRFIADFCCPERGLVVELDGGQHVAQVKADRRRTTFLLGRGYRVLRFWDSAVMSDIEVVLQRIAEAITDPHPNPLPEGEGRRKGFDRVQK